jgi:hypothetical protein
VIAYQEILGAEKAENFVESLQTLIEHLENRQGQLSTELQETTVTLEVFKRLRAGSNGTVTEAIAIEAISHLEQAVIPQLSAVPEPVESEEAVASLDNTDVESAPEVVTEAPKSGRSTTSKRPKEKSLMSPAVAKPADPPKSLTFHPRQSILREFEGKPLQDAIIMILKRAVGEPFSIDDILSALYGKKIGKESIKAARPVVIAELSKGKLANYWSSVAGRRGYYMMKPDAKPK